MEIRFPVFAILYIIAFRLLLFQSTAQECNIWILFTMEMPDGRRQRNCQESALLEDVEVLLFSVSFCLRLIKGTVLQQGNKEISTLVSGLFKEQEITFRSA